MFFYFALHIFYIMFLLCLHKNTTQLSSILTKNVMLIPIIIGINSLNENFCVLWWNRIIPMSIPILPPNKESEKMVISGIRYFFLIACCLSYPIKKIQMTLIIIK